MKLKVTTDFNYIVAVRDHEQGRTVTIYSQWLGAKRPDEYQCQVQMTLQREDWDRIADALKED